MTVKTALINEIIIIPLQRIKKLEEEANYQVLKPLPDSISVDGDLKISLEDVDGCCTLKSEKHQVSRAI